MDVNANQNLAWTLAVFRHSEMGDEEQLNELTQFRFGRFRMEFDDTPVSILPPGLISLIREHGVEGDALETGFMVHMTTRRTDSDWLRFDQLAAHKSWIETIRIGRNPRAVYCSEDLEGCVEFVEIGPCSPLENGLPEAISIRVTPLPLPLVAWGFSNGMFSCPKTNQITLDKWVELPELKPEKSTNVLALPGPSHREYSFFQDSEDF